jgi:CBS domain-containing protein/sporulation protein YlmC with PRC-barrel domain
MLRTLTKNIVRVMITQSLISVAGLVGRPVVHKDGLEVGHLVDLVFRWDTQKAYPPLSGIVVRVGRRLSWIPAGEVQTILPKTIHLRTARIDLRDIQPRDGEVRLAKDVLDHQLVDVEGARVVRASDLYVATINNQIHLVGVDVGLASLLRRLGPSALRSRPTTGNIIDWATIQSFGQQEGKKAGLRLSKSQSELRRLRPGELADLLEDLGREERQELLSSLQPEQVADALEEMHSDELEGILRESSPAESALYLANMEPDEAAEALRDVDAELREDLLARMPDEASDQVEEVLAFEENSAGGIMTPAIVTAGRNETVDALRRRLSQDVDDYRELDAIVLIDDDGKLINDIPLTNLFLARPKQTLSELTTVHDPITVSPGASVKEVATLLSDNRRLSLLVVDEQGKPLGRILADDIVDALLPERNRFHFPRLLS